MGKTKKPNQGILKNSLEAIQGYGTDVAKSAAKTTTEEFDTLFADLLGLGSNAESGEQQAHNGEIEVFNREKKSESRATAHIEYHRDIVKSSEHANRAENSQALKQIREALAEIQQLIKSSKTLEMEFAEFAVMSEPTEVGQYDLNFFEWLMLTIKQAREKVEDSGAWLAAVKGKNGKKGQDYWSMFKKHGTSFGMSNERSTATSVG